MKNKEKVFTAIEKVTGISKSEIVGKTKKSKITQARMIYYLIMFNYKNTHQDIIESVNRVAHASSIYGIRKIIAEMELYDDVREMYEAIQNEL